MAEKSTTRSERFYGGKDKGKKDHKGGSEKKHEAKLESKPAKKDGDGKAAEPESIHAKHAREVMETHKRHGTAREAINKTHEEELAAMAQRHAAEMDQGPGTPGGMPAPGAMNNAGAGAAGGTPPMVAGANAA